MTKPESRLVRIFISSTFRDFMGERDELVKKVFPELRRRCKARFVELLEVDLRWGITEEQSKQGATLKICLQEIDRCRPSAPVFFIGLLGERYGWVPPPDYYPRDVLEDPGLSWVQEHIGGKSVTELEVLHGVLNNPAMAERAFFYFRQDGYEQRHWDQIATAYPDLRPTDFTNEGDTNPGEAQAKQESLKNRILAADLKHAPRDYETPGEVATMILDALWAQIDAAFPAATAPDAFELESMNHAAFRDSRTRFYVERDELIDALDAHAAAKGSSCRILLGDSGSGKSSLLSAWLARNENKVVFFHFTGATQQSGHADNLLRRLLETLVRRCAGAESETIPDDPIEMANKLPVWLDRLARTGGGVILLDALNQLESPRDRNLWWWPMEWPKEIRLVISTIMGDVWIACKKRGWTHEHNVIEVPLLQPEEKMLILDRYMSLFARHISDDLKYTIVTDPLTDNPLALRTILDELRIHSSHENLSRDIATMLACPDIPGLFGCVIKGLQHDHSVSKETPGVHPIFVRVALGLLASAKRGLTEQEMLELLSTSTSPSKKPVPRHYWSPLLLALDDSVISHNGKLTISHEYFRRAIERECLSGIVDVELIHGLLGQLSFHYSTDAYSSTLISYGLTHGPYHLRIARDYDALWMMINNPAFIQRQWDEFGRPNEIINTYEQAIMAYAAIPECNEKAIWRLVYCMNAANNYEPKIIAIDYAIKVICNPTQSIESVTAAISALHILDADEYYLVCISLLVDLSTRYVNENKESYNIAASILAEDVLKVCSNKFKWNNITYLNDHDLLMTLLSSYVFMIVEAAHWNNIVNMADDYAARNIKVRTLALLRLLGYEMSAFSLHEYLVANGIVDADYLTEWVSTYTSHLDQALQDAAERPVVENIINHLTAERNEVFRTRIINQVAPSLIMHNMLNMLPKMLYNISIKTVESQENNRSACELLLVYSNALCENMSIKYTEYLWNSIINKALNSGASWYQGNADVERSGTMAKIALALKSKGKSKMFSTVLSAMVKISDEALDVNSKLICMCNIIRAFCYMDQDCCQIIKKQCKKTIAHFVDNIELLRCDDGNLALSMAQLVVCTEKCSMINETKQAKRALLRYLNMYDAHDYHRLKYLAETYSEFVNESTMEESASTRTLLAKCMRIPFTDSKEPRWKTSSSLRDAILSISPSAHERYIQKVAYHAGLRFATQTSIQELSQLLDEGIMVPIVRNHLIRGYREGLSNNPDSLPSLIASMQWPEWNNGALFHGICCLLKCYGIINPAQTALWIRKLGMIK